MNTSLSLTPSLALTQRNLQNRVGGSPNAHQRWYQVRNSMDGPLLGPLRIVINYVLIELSKHSPSLTAKRWLMRRLGAHIGYGVTFGSGSAIDYFFPELIEIGDNTIIGMDCLILSHEFLHNRTCYGPTRIGSDCLIGARSTVLAGTEISPHTTVAAMSLVHRGTPPHSLVGGVPIRIIRCCEQSPIVTEAN